MPYNLQPAFVIIGTKADDLTRTQVTLETSYQTDESTEAVKTFEVADYDKLNLDVFYSTGAGEAGTSVQTIMEGTNDGTNFYRFSNDSTSGATSTLTQREFNFVPGAAGNYSYQIPVDVFYKKVRVSFKEAGVSSNAGSVFVEARLKDQ